MTIICIEQKPFLIEYWSQVTFILLTFGYIIQTIWSKILRQKEITYTHVTQNKITEVKAYIRSYNELVFILSEYYYISAQNQNEKLFEIKEKVSKSWTNFIVCYSTLKIFLKKEDYQLYNDVENQLQEVQKLLFYNEIDKHFGNTDKDALNKLREIRDEIFPKKLPELIKRIEESLKQDMGIK